MSTEKICSMVVMESDHVTEGRRQKVHWDILCYIQNNEWKYNIDVVLCHSPSPQNVTIFSKRPQCDKIHNCIRMSNIQNSFYYTKLTATCNNIPKSDLVLHVATNYNVSLTLISMVINTHTLAQPRLKPCWH